MTETTLILPQTGQSAQTAQLTDGAEMVPQLMSDESFAEALADVCAMVAGIRAAQAEFSPSASEVTAR